MKIFGFNISRGSTPPQQKSFSPATLSWMKGEDVDQGGAVLCNAYQQVVWVYRAINVLAEQIANVPFLFSSGERGRENLITSGPLLDFYSRPHPQINRFQYWELRIIWLMLRGECFRIPIYSDDLNPNPNRDRNRSCSLSDACPDGVGVGGEEVVSPTHSLTRSHPHSARRLSRIIIPDPAHF